MTRIRITNRDARRLWLAQMLLTEGPRDPAEIIRALGFLQIDTIRNVARAQDHILWSRATGYREERVWRLLKSRALFEHFTHDASLIPAEVLPYWSRRFRVLGDRVARGSWYHSGLAQDEIHRIRDRIEAEGPLSTHAFDTKIEGAREMWARPPHKKALDQMWYAGTLGTSHREKFVKFYDLGSRVFPEGIDHGKTEAEQVDWLCGRAIDRLGVATRSEITWFWQAATPAEVKHWSETADLVPVAVEAADGSTTEALALPDIVARIAAAPSPGTRMRLINPFDPAIRDRARLERLFGFAYRNEMFVPKSKRVFGYYVYPLLEGDRFVGRIELRADRQTGELCVVGFWPEPGVKWPASRGDRLTAELERFRRFAGLEALVWDAPCPRP